MRTISAEAGSLTFVPAVAEAVEARGKVVKPRRMTFGLASPSIVIARPGADPVEPISGKTTLSRVELADLLAQAGKAVEPVAARILAQYDGSKGEPLTPAEDAAWDALDAFVAAASILTLGKVGRALR